MCPWDFAHGKCNMCKHDKIMCEICGTNVPCSSEMCCAHSHDICEANVNSHMIWLSLSGYMQKLWYYK